MEYRFTEGQKVQFTCPWYLGGEPGTGTITYVGKFDAYTVQLDTPLQLDVDGVEDTVSELLFRENSLRAL